MCAALFVLAPAASAQMSLKHPPKGANNFNCKPSAAHPYPVVLVHGLSATMAENWSYISPRLAARGYCVFALTYGLDPRFPQIGGVIPIQRSAHELAGFVHTVLHDTGASKVDLVGHSEGTFMPEYWLKYLGGAGKVERYVAMTPLYHGTKLLGAAQLRDAGKPYGLSKPFLRTIDLLCASCTQFIAGSRMVRKLNAHGGPEVPGIRYTTIMTTNDELVVPYTSGMLPPPAKNIVLQKVCPNDISEHVFEAFDPVVLQLVENALDPAHSEPVNCGLLPPLL